MTVVVTGASRGIGHLLCRRLVAQGIPVVGLARRIEDLDFPARSCDVADADAVRLVAHQLRDERLPVRGLVNAAGIASMNLALTTPARTAASLVATNLLGTIYCCQQFAPLMIRRRAGAIVNFSSVAAALGLAGESVYAASKAGVETFSLAFAREVAAFGLRVNCVAPGPVDTGLLRGLTTAQIDAVVGRQVLPQRCTPEQVCELVELLLLDRRAATLSGQVLIPGGV